VLGLDVAPLAVSPAGDTLGSCSGSTLPGDVLGLPCSPLRWRRARRWLDAGGGDVGVLLPVPDRAGAESSSRRALGVMLGSRRPRRRARARRSPVSTAGAPLAGSDAPGRLDVAPPVAGRRAEAVAPRESASRSEGSVVSLAGDTEPRNRWGPEPRRRWTPGTSGRGSSRAPRWTSRRSEIGGRKPPAETPRNRRRGVFACASDNSIYLLYLGFTARPRASASARKSTERASVEVDRPRTVRRCLRPETRQGTGDRPTRSPIAATRTPREAPRSSRTSNPGADPVERLLDPFSRHAEFVLHHLPPPTPGGGVARTSERARTVVASHAPRGTLDFGNDPRKKLSGIPWGSCAGPAKARVFTKNQNGESGSSGSSGEVSLTGDTVAGGEPAGTQRRARSRRCAFRAARASKIFAGVVGNLGANETHARACRRRSSSASGSTSASRARRFSTSRRRSLRASCSQTWQRTAGSSAFVGTPCGQNVIGGLRRIFIGDASRSRRPLPRDREEAPGTPRSRVESLPDAR